MPRLSPLLLLVGVRLVSGCTSAPTPEEPSPYDESKPLAFACGWYGENRDGEHYLVMTKQSVPYGARVQVLVTRTLEGTKTEVHKVGPGQDIHILGGNNIRVTTADGCKAYAPLPAEPAGIRQ